MMQPGEQPGRTWFCCLLCRERLKDPATLQCGHRFCLNCIKKLWGQQDERGVNCCPQCRKTFTATPGLNRNKRAPKRRRTGPEGLACDLGSGRRVRALKSCLLCSVSCCSQHLQPHFQSPPLKRHQRVELQILKQLEPDHETRAGFLKHSKWITLDPNTANICLSLSEGNRRVTCQPGIQTYPPHPGRFTVWSQVLSRESLSGPGYWEVDWTQGVGVGVAYEKILRAGSSYECEFGFNRNSWVLHRDGHGYNFYHNKVRAPVSGPGSSRVGVYLDHGAGVLSFYRVSDTMTLLHRVRASFTRPLCAAVRFYCNGSTAEFCPLK